MYSQGDSRMVINGGKEVVERKTSAETLVGGECSTPGHVRRWTFIC